MVTTFTDGFGLWHAVVPDIKGARRLAIKAIRSELSARGESKDYRLKVDRIPTPRGIAGKAHFVER